jgi:hypothetical protein
MALVFIEFWLGERKSRCCREGNCIPALHVFVSPRSCIRVPSNPLLSSGIDILVEQHLNAHACVAVCELFPTCTGRQSGEGVALRTINGPLDYRRPSAAQQIEQRSRAGLQFLTSLRWFWPPRGIATRSLALRCW